MLRLAARPLSTTLGVVGCGLMGSGIVQMAATAGYRVISLEKDPKVLEKGLAMTGANVARALKSAVKKGKMTDTDAAQKEKDIMARIVPSTDLADFKECGLAIEAIVENMDAKIALFSDLEGIMADSAIIATNTSSLSVEKMGAKMAKRDRLLGLHFFNPVPLMPLCEVVKTNETSEDAMARALAFVEKCGKKSIICRDSPGFVVNRILIPTLIQACLLVDAEIASVADIDTGMRLGAGWPMGVLHLADYVGIDTLHFAISGWRAEYPGEPAFVMPKCLDKLFREGKLGRKTGQGFYKWDGDRVVG